MNRLVSSAAIAAITILASVPALPASAAPVTLTVKVIDPLPGQAIAVTGDGDDCPADTAGAAGTFVVTLTYATPANAAATVTAAGPVAADGTFASTVTLPENASSASSANIVASTSCSGTTTESNRVALKVLYHPGTLSLSTKSVPAGGSVTATGAGCYGGEFVVLYGSAGGDPTKFTSGTSGTPAADRTFVSTLTVPATQKPGSYDVYALCPGTDFPEQKLTVSAAASLPSASASPPATTSLPAPTVAASVPVTTTTLGGGFTDVSINTTVAGTTTTTAAPVAGGGTTPVATAPVAVRGEAAFTG